MERGSVDKTTMLRYSLLIFLGLIGIGAILSDYLPRGFSLLLLIIGFAGLITFNIIARRIHSVKVPKLENFKIKVEDIVFTILLVVLLFSYKTIFALDNGIIIFFSLIVTWVIVYIIYKGITKSKSRKK